MVAWGGKRTFQQPSRRRFSQGMALGGTCDVAAAMARMSWRGSSSICSAVFGQCLPLSRGPAW